MLAIWASVVQQDDRLEAWDSTLRAIAAAGGCTKSLGSIDHITTT
ncbi:hypothetical protein QUB47_20655 [Microcoleus sp. AT9_B5]